VGPAEGPQWAPLRHRWRGCGAARVTSNGLGNNEIHDESTSRDRMAHLMLGAGGARTRDQWITEPWIWTIPVASDMPRATIDFGVTA
jgi:hypothetical protein